MYTFDNKSILKNGNRWFPIMGEIHFSRYPKQYWKESLCKMKAGGVDIVSAYVIWIHHEEIENEYDFSGDKDLHAFVQACKECDVKLLLRIGPWSHGEVRNGGFPDWLLKKDFEVRTNDEAYFATVEKWYKKVYEQVSDFFADEETNPIIGVQIENEFGHCGGLYDETGEVHMQRLYKMACDIGFKVSLYTATGWGGARTGGLLPVMGGYCDAPWDQRITEIEPSGNFIFTYERNDHNIGSDYGLHTGITFDVSKFPYLTAELGGGLQVTQHRRTVATADDIGAVSLTKMGSGVNLLGYYMYHGGTNPDGKLTTLQESRETGYPNDLPVKSYDFRAPVREFGQVSETLRRLKLYAYFVHDYGSDFCSMDAKIPEDNPLMPGDTEHLRYSFRSNGKSGYAFVNNYVRLRKMPEYKNQKLVTPEGTVFPDLNISDGDYFFLPYNMAYGNHTVKTALVSPLCKITSAEGKPVYVFYDALKNKQASEYFQMENNSAEKPEFLVLSKKNALNAWKTKEGGIVISEGTFMKNPEGNDELTVRCSSKVYAYPALKNVPAGLELCGSENLNLDKTMPAYNFAVYNVKGVEEAVENPVAVEKTGQDEKAVTYKMDASELMKKFREKAAGNVSDCFLSIKYIGESAKLYCKAGGERKLLLDNFFLGKDYDWEIGLKRFLNSEVDFSNLELEINRLMPDAKIYFEKPVEVSKEGTAELLGTAAQFEYKFIIK